MFFALFHGKTKVYNKIPTTSQSIDKINFGPTNFHSNIILTFLLFQSAGQINHKMNFVYQPTNCSSNDKRCKNGE